jgi:hypothetical protein
MRKLLLAFGLFTAGCMTAIETPAPGADLAQAPSGGGDLAQAASPDLGGGGGADLAGGGSVGTAAFGATCTQNTDCASNMCEPFAQQTEHLCTKSCTVATQATDCPDPPSAGTCTPNLYCRFN